MIVRRFLLTFLMLVSLLGSSGTQAWTGGPFRSAFATCATFFENLKIRFGKNKKELEGSPGATAAQTVPDAQPAQSASVTPKVPVVPHSLRDGGAVKIGDEEFYKFLRDGPEWKMENGQDYFRGNPDWAVDLAGRKTMEDLGFRYDDTVVLVPTAETYNSRIAKLNKELKPGDEIVLQYYTPEIDNVPAEEYVRELGRFRHPAAKGTKGASNESPHDANFHPPLLPKEWYEQIARRARVTVGFVDWLKTNRPDVYNSTLYRSKTVKSFLDERLQQVASDLDVATAVSVSHPKHPEDYFPIQGYWTNGYFGMLKHVFFSGKNSIDFLNEKFGLSSFAGTGFNDALKDYLATVKDKPEYQIAVSKTADQLSKELEARLNMFRERK